MTSPGGVNALRSAPDSVDPRTAPCGFCHPGVLGTASSPRGRLGTPRCNLHFVSAFSPVLHPRAFCLRSGMAPGARFVGLAGSEHCEDRRWPAGRQYHRRHADGCHGRKWTGAPLFGRLYARRPALFPVLRVPGHFFLLDAGPGSGRQFPAALCVLGTRGAFILSADRLLVRKAFGGCGMQESVPGKPRRRPGAFSWAS